MYIEHYHYSILLYKSVSKCTRQDLSQDSAENHTMEHFEELVLYIYIYLVQSPRYGKGGAAIVNSSGSEVLCGGVSKAVHVEIAASSGGRCLGVCSQPLGICAFQVLHL